MVVALIEGLPVGEQAVWATAAYAGLRMGELRALRVNRVNGLEQAEGYIDVCAGWDAREGEIAPKYEASVRWVPLPETLRAILAAHVTRTKRSGSDFLFGPEADRQFCPDTIQDRADVAWRVAGVQRVTLHLLRHGYGSFLDAAGISDARSRRYLGHAGASVSDRYRHRLLGQLRSDAELLDRYLLGKGAEVVELHPTGAQSGAQETASG